ncbi:MULTISPECIES: helix-turn-helix transcriptional regulator [unclassified Bradyrhizobium]|uniref:helix-turn-helix transcriptional regulator n=1 Tax=unclassified Bradyrhizobium TaxID=2631580 RepID=UPI00211E2891|nr:MULTISPECIES: LuxR C-terminal-related transcriptional regulator [unclassified Bradyrhizobium]MDD1535421.1 helix-turn-helix transcriptional regulator [Bradyrhizobium sp. WBOS8]MDD1581950.1 helix-turn-helix transcriptional regulator [Bradyrhizobium sp. WBOS4]UUO47463.1 helix-turn-helix transcriptional regulator [Bradyrhizobium sp. WBOS04]UUO61079.1 helix-turn-helix transcriptional regulator [Bradyrhizobium sp. WBOS08]
MQISTRKQRTLSGIIGLLSATHETGRELRTVIGPLLLDLLDADFYASYAWNAQKQAFELGVSVNLDAACVQTYERYFQHRHKERLPHWLLRGVHPVSALISHRELMRTEIYNEFLRPFGHYYGINLFAFDGADSIGDVRIWRRKGRPDFGNAEVELLRLIEPGFTQALKRTALSGTPATRAREPAKLSPREAAVAELAAKGLADKQIAQRLNVSFGTVRTHLDNAFAKLGVRNRTQLASLLHAVEALRQPRTTH